MLSSLRRVTRDDVAPLAGLLAVIALLTLAISCSSEPKTDGGPGETANANATVDPEANLPAANANALSSHTDSNTPATNTPAANRNVAPASNTPAANTAPATNSNAPAASNNAPATNAPASNNAPAPDANANPTPPATSGPVPPEANTRALRKVVPGEAFPDIDLPVLDNLGRKLSISSLRGKYVVIEFWASWCESCKQQATDWMMPLHLELGTGDDAKIAFVSIGITLNNDTAEKQLIEVQTGGHTWLHLYDADGNAVSLYGVRQTPALVILDPDGRVVTCGRLVGEWADEAKVWLRKICGQ